MKIAVIRPIGTPIRTASAVPMMEVKITYRIPKDGSAASGFHTVPNKTSRIPTFPSAGVPFKII